MLRSMTARVRAAISVLLVLFLALVLVQLVVGERLQAAQQQHTERLGDARTANRAVLQNMTDAETGVRGFQLTGDREYLGPYESGKVAAFVAFDRVAELSADDEVRRWLTAERTAAAHWLYAYAIPIVNAGVADRNDALADRGKRAFDRIRLTNAYVEDALRAEQQSVTAADRSRIRSVQMLFGGLAILFLAVAMVMAAVHQRHLLAPLEDIRRTLRRLAAGDRSARAVPSGTAELRAVIGTLNDLAAETERLLAAEQARGVRHELRQQVATELRRPGGAQVTAARVAEMLGAFFGAAVVHGRVAVEPGAGVSVRWPDAAEPLAPEIVAAVQAGAPGEPALVADVPGGLAVALPGDAQCPPGLLCLARPDRPDWTDEERRLLGTLAREVEHAIRQQRLHIRQARLISELQTLDERKDAFVATVTHELRTPLTSILGYTEMLTDDDDDLTPPQRRGLGAILRNALRLRDTVADLLLLDPGAQRAGGPSVPVDLTALTTAVVADVAPAARAKGLLLTLDEAAGPAWVAGEPDRLERAVRNLLDNAVKFTPSGGRIVCRAGAEAGTATVEISDTGIGVPAGDLPGLFTPFHRGANAMDQAVQGSGLGLAIVHAIVTEHDGALAVRSVLGGGSTFTVSIPALAEISSAEREPIGPSAANQ
ncbi:ATP-binding protein [Actinoplanes sp. NPDC051470]|uniref:ATP-binding protein n=1 Tax=Actinoplanes sp. NPDC051470 TaxID=3157224 RepID=UPI0034136D00